MTHLSRVRAECIEHDDTKEKVVHKVYATINGIRYQRELVAECPIDAIDIARSTPIVIGKYWHEVERPTRRT